MNEQYDVVFCCYWAEYYWIVKEPLSLEEAEKLVLIENKREKVHGNKGCCQYFVQKK